MLEQVQAVATLFATGFGTYLAWGGLSAWKRETTGKRDIELCQKVIEMFYEAEHRMNILRSPLIYAGEGEEREREKGESEDETRRRNQLFAPLARYDKQVEFWSELFSYRFKMRALFGPAATKAFDPIDDALRNFRAAALTRYQSLHASGEGLHRETDREFIKVLAAGSKPDAIAEQMTTAIQAMEAICIPIVRSTRPINPAQALWHRVSRS